MFSELMKELSAVGLQPLVIDENTDFSQLPPLLDDPQLNDPQSTELITEEEPLPYLSRKVILEQYREAFKQAKQEPDTTKFKELVNVAKARRNALLKVPKPRSGARNKAAGHVWEYELVGRLREIGFAHATTTRGTSKERDAQKIDIMNKDERVNGFLPFNAQAKNMARPPAFQAILASMPNDGIPNILLFKQTAKAARKFVKVGEYAIMDVKDWFYYIQIEKNYKKLEEDNLKLSQQLEIYKRNTGNES